MIRQVSAQDVHRARLAGEALTLVDCREDAELAIARVDGAVHIPMTEIPQRLSEIDRARNIVVMCHHGVRSLQVAAFLAQKGVADVASLIGGIDAWSYEIDSDVPRY